MQEAIIGTLVGVILGGAASAAFVWLPLKNEMHGVQTGLAVMTQQFADWHDAVERRLEKLEDA